MNCGNRKSRNNQAPLVTVFCTVYNHENYISDALNGFIGQKTSFPFEVLVHDDASTDSSAQIIKEYCSRYPSILIPIFEENNQYSQGKWIMREIMLPRARGDYIAFCEGDDYWCDKSKLQQQIDFLESHPEYSACAHNSLRLDVSSGRSSVMYTPETLDLPLERVLEKGGAYWQLASFVCRRSVLEHWPEFLIQAGGNGDYKLAINACLQGKIRYIGTVMSVYRFLTSGSWSMRCRRDANLLASSYFNVIKLLEGLDDYTGQKYHSAISQAILNNKYFIEESRFNFEVLSSGEYRDIYEQKTLQYRIKNRMKTILKPIYLSYRKIKFK